MSNDIKKDILDFLFIDFKEISEKLEATDKKVQFFIQIYITLIGASLTFIVTYIGKTDINNFNTQTYFCIFLISFILFVISQLILCYVLSGQKLHTDYICKLNIIRCLILKNLKQTEDFIENYGYTKCFVPRKGGMNNWMIYLIIFIIILFVAIGFWSLFNCTNNSFLRAMLILSYIVISGIIFIVNKYIYISHCDNIESSVKNLNENLKKLKKIASK